MCNPPQRLCADWSKTPPQRLGDIPEHSRRRIEQPLDCADTGDMSRYVVRWVYILLAVVVCPLLAWHLAVDATNHGFGARGFFIMLLGLPVIGALLAATLLRRRR